jgi:Protein of unknown function (DUF3592)
MHFLAGLPWWAWPSMAAIIALYVWYRIRFRQPTIKGPALTGTAKILSVQQTTGPMREGHNLALRIALRVEVPGRQPYDVKVERTVDLNHMARVQPGATIPVWVDPTNPQKVRIDFTQPIA